MKTMRDLLNILNAGGEGFTPRERVTTCVMTAALIIAAIVAGVIW